MNHPHSSQFIRLMDRLIGRLVDAAKSIFDHIEGTNKQEHSLVDVILPSSSTSQIWPPGNCNSCWFLVFLGAIKSWLHHPLSVPFIRSPLPFRHSSRNHKYRQLTEIHKEGELVEVLNGNTANQSISLLQGVVRTINKSSPCLCQGLISIQRIF